MNATDDDYWNEKSFDGFSFEDEDKELNLIKKMPPECEDLTIGLTKTKLENVEALDTLLSKEILDKIFVKQDSESNESSLNQNKQNNVKSTIESIVMSYKYTLEPFRSLEEKKNAIKRSVRHRRWERYINGRYILNKHFEEGYFSAYFT